MNKRTYQYHGDDYNPMSDSMNKLKRIQLPDDMTGMSFLDIGCNEGFFCAEALRRGASKVIGIDYDKNAIDFALNKYGANNAFFINQGWDTLPDEKFDVILWASAMHYESKPKNIISMIHKRLKRYGVFILECGVSDGSAKEMFIQQRKEDSLWYPTYRLLLDDLLAQFSVRQVTDGHLPVGDSIERFVFHCQRSMPTVMILTGGFQAGKTALARKLDDIATQYVGIDNLIGRIANGKFHHGNLAKFLKLNYNPYDLMATYAAIDEKGLTEEFCSYIVQNIYWGDDFFVLDGALTDKQVDFIKNILNMKAIVWISSRVV